VLAWDLVNVEAMSYDVLVNGVDWQWESFPDYIKAATRRVALNVGFLVPLSALRLYAMGGEAAARAASEDEIRTMAQILRDALRGGRLDFRSVFRNSTSDTRAGRWRAGSQAMMNCARSRM
jgi:N-acyl-D-aspartate/D-glutamate deacylase